MRLPRLHTRRPGKDRGDILLETIVAIGLIGLLSLLYLGTSVQAKSIQRTSVNHSIAEQTAEGALEKARATGWADLGTDVEPVAGLLPAGSTALTGGKLPARATPTIRKQSLTVDTAVSWSKQPVNGTTFGEKLVVVEVTWFDKPGVASTKHSVRQTTVITPGIGEAPPSTIPGA